MHCVTYGTRCFSVGCNMFQRKAAIGTAGVEKHNSSFDSSVCMPVTHRNKRSVWTVPTGEGLGDHTSIYRKNKNQFQREQSGGVCFCDSAGTKSQCGRMRGRNACLRGA